MMHDKRGFGAWRRTIHHIHKGRGLRLDRLHDEIRVFHTKSFAKLEDVELGIVRFDPKHAEYAEAGGDHPSNRTLIKDLCNMLPRSIQRDLTWRISNAENMSCMQFKNYFLQQTATDLATQPRHGVHIIDDEGDSGDNELEVLYPGDFGTIDEYIMASQEQLNIIQRNPNKFIKKDASRNRRDTRRPTTRPTQPANGSQRELKCGNCNDVGHNAAPCTKPRLEFKKRLCHKCKKPGHLAKDCRSKDVISAVGQPVKHGGPALRILGGSNGRGAINDDFQPVRRGTPPQKAQPILIHFVKENSFAPVQPQRARKAGRHQTAMTILPSVSV